MRPSVKRAGYLVAMVLLTLVGTISVAGPASAETQPNTLILTTKTRACPSSCGVQDAADVLANTAIHTFCVQNGYDLTYTGPASARAGFIFRLRLQFPDLQKEACDAAGIPGTVNRAMNLSSCTGTCVNFGGVVLNDQAGIHCQRSGFFLVYINRIQRAGFLPTSAVSTPISVPDCNRGF